jgi:hypothetical protein
MKTAPSPSEIRNLFANGDPDEVWAKATGVVERIDPAFDFSQSHTAFDDVVCLFRGEYPDYRPISTLYHDLQHTMDVFLCAVRLLHGAHVSGISLSAGEITRTMIAALMHDVGYAQLYGDDSGTGAKYTKIHVSRGIEFMRSYLAYRHFPADWAESLESMMRCTDPGLILSRIHFSGEKARLLGQLVGTADLVGQMADRTYLEKLLLLYFEFKEAHIGNFNNMYELLRGTMHFYEVTQKKLDSEYGGLHALLAHHFKAWFGVERDYYRESIARNIDYLSRVLQLNEADYLTMLKRGGIVEEMKNIVSPDDLA